MPSLPDIGFYFVAGLAIVSAAAVVIHPNPLRCALFLVLNFLCVAVLFLSLNAQLVAVLQILVYAGAIVVLFIFVIMLLNLGGEGAQRDALAGQKWIGGLLGLAVLASVAAGVAFVAGDASPAGHVHRMEEIVHPEMLPAEAGTHQIHQISLALFTQYGYAFELTGVLLLVGLIGVVLLAKVRPAGSSGRREGGDA